MPSSLDLSILPLRVVLHPAPMLAPEDTLARFVQMARNQATTLLPVLEDGYLRGIVSLQDALPILEIASQEERQTALERPVAEVMHPPAIVARPDMTLEEIGKICADLDLSLIPVVDEANYCLGVIYATDLLVPDMPTPRPATIGGMATPFGVYLTNGTLQAGVGNGALVATGVLMGLLLSLSYGLIEGGVWLAHQYSPGHIPLLLSLDNDPSPQHPFLGYMTIGLRALGLLLFLLLMRATRLAGYHAAEHQTVHAIERGEKLTTEIVRRMPRPHPRCGTNFMAAGFLFFTLMEAFAYIPFLNAGAEIFAALATVFTWRSVGTFLQERFTTKPANDREIASGIAAGNDLLHKYLHATVSRSNLMRRLWCMGLFQTMGGTFLAFGTVWAVRSLLGLVVLWK